MEQQILEMTSGQRKTFSKEGKTFNVHADLKYPFNDAQNIEFCIFIYETANQTIPKAVLKSNAKDCFEYINNY